MVLQLTRHGTRHQISSFDDLLNIIRKYNKYRQKTIHYKIYGKREALQETKNSSDDDVNTLDSPDQQYEHVKWLAHGLLKIMSLVEWLRRGIKGIIWNEVSIRPRSIPPSEDCKCETPPRSWEAPWRLLFWAAAVLGWHMRLETIANIWWGERKWLCIINFPQPKHWNNLLWQNTTPHLLTDLLFCQREESPPPPATPCTHTQNPNHVGFSGDVIFEISLCRYFHATANPSQMPFSFMPRFYMVCLLPFPVLLQLRESFKDIKKKFNNLKFNYMKKNEKLRNMKAVKNQIQQIDIYLEKLQVRPESALL